MLVFLCGCLLTFLSALYIFLTWNYQHWTKRGIPFAEPQILSGNLPSLVNQKRHIAYDLDDLYNKFKDEYSIIGFFSMRQPQYLVTDARVARDILISKFKYFHDNEFSDMIDEKKDPIFGNNPFMLKGQQWREARAEITPAFTQLRIKSMYPIMDEMCERLQKFIFREKHEAIEARNMCANYTTEVLSSCIFGADAGALLDKKAPIREMGRKLLGFTPTVALYFLAIQLIPSLRKFIKIGLVPWNGWKFFVNLMEDAIEMRKGSREIREDYLSYLIELQAKKNLTTRKIMAHAMAFFVCGFETSSVALSFVLYQLAKNADVQERLRNEIRKTIEKNGKLSYSVIQEMPYLEQILCETHRLHPVFPILAKLCTESCEMPLTEHKTVTIEKGYSVVLPLHSIHRDSKYYENPDIFNPERFSPENGGSKVYRDRGCYLPFGDGPRICPGMRFAQTQIKAAIVAIVKDFEVKLDARTSLEPMLNPEEIIPTIIGGIWLRFTECKEEI